MLRYFSAPIFLRFTLTIIILTGLTACDSYDKQQINALLDARDLAVSSHNIKDYDALLLPGYHDHLGQSEFDIVSKMNKLFAQFEKIEMTSSNRVIRRTGNNDAECEQSYLLRVKADGTWRQLNQRERISLSKTNEGWKISGGL